MEAKTEDNSGAAVAQYANKTRDAKRTDNMLTVSFVTVMSISRFDDKPSDSSNEPPQPALSSALIKMPSSTYRQLSCMINWNLFYRRMWKKKDQPCPDVRGISQIDIYRLGDDHIEQDHESEFIALARSGSSMRAFFCRKVKNTSKPIWERYTCKDEDSEKNKRESSEEINEKESRKSGEDAEAPGSLVATSSPPALQDLFSTIVQSFKDVEQLKVYLEHEPDDGSMLPLVACGNLRSLKIKLPLCKHVKDSVVFDIASSLTNLHTLYIEEGPLGFTDEVLEALANNTRLREFMFTFKDPTTVTGATHVSKMTTLESLTIVVHSASFATFYDPDILGNRGVPDSSIRDKYADSVFEMLKVISEGLKNLHHLCITGNQGITENAIALFTKNLCQLRKISFDWIGLTDNGLGSVAENCVKLKEFDFGEGFYQPPSEQAIYEFVKCTPTLRKIGIFLPACHINEDLFSNLKRDYPQLKIRRTFRQLCDCFDDSESDEDDVEPGPRPDN